MAIGFVVGTMWFSWVLRPNLPKEEKLSTYECGENPVGMARLQFNFRYYVFALLFILFEVEAVFLYPWAVRFSKFIREGLGGFIVIEMIIFVLILVLGLIYAWRCGDLKWV